MGFESSRDSGHKTDRDRFNKLLNDYLNDNLNHFEVNELFTLIRNENYSSELEQFLDQTFKSKEYSGLSDKTRYGMLFNRLMKAAKEQVAFEEPSVNNGRSLTVKRKLVGWISVAASIVALVAFGSLWITRNLQESQIQIAGQIDLPPGGNRASLTLGDGSTILLDSAINGVLADESGTLVEKVADGKLRYSTDAKANKGTVYNTVTTPRAGQYALVLPDGSQVWLNSESTIKFPVAFPEGSRTVEITGEAYFDIVKDPEAPFKVITANTVVEVLGTSFNVRAYSDEMLVYTTLVEGSVRLNLHAASTEIAPGQQAITDPAGNTTINNNADLIEITSWRNGLFIFNSENIESIMDEIARWYDVEVEYDGPVSSETFSGIVKRTSNVSEILKIMQQAGIKFTLTPGKITVAIE